MIHLLTEPTTFIPQPNNCYLQLTGPPMDGLWTIAKIEEEARTRAMVQRKRSLIEEARRARKRRKLRTEGDQGEEREEMEMEGLETARGKTRHTSSWSGAVGGDKSVSRAIFFDRRALIEWLTAPSSIRRTRSPIDVTIPRMKMFYARHRLGKQQKATFRGVPEKRARLLFAFISDKT